MDQDAWIHMDPRLEQSGLWLGFHNQLIVTMAHHLAQALRPRYLVQTEERVYVTRDAAVEAVRRPDVSVAAVSREGAPVVEEPAPARRRVATPVLAAIGMRDEVKEWYLQVRSLTGELVTVVEVLSPNNKRAGHEGRQEYLTKRDEYLSARVNLVEIDLLLSGERMPLASPWPEGDRFVLVRRAFIPGQAEIYGVHADQPLPAFRFPLREPDPDHVLDLQEIFEETWTRGAFDLLVENARQDMS
ncbi:DUF4058 family protein [Limnochorda pilosa]|uniref:DUF4058 family protein n=1 Tax=Limnochorda pilosa TaxID=1555112 RepID=UPI0011874BFA|nr:DUF4058 family protein [Limnochorda pilosa]